MEARPVKVIPVHEYLRPKLVELYESDCIFDKFEVRESRGLDTPFCSPPARMPRGTSLTHPPV